MQPPAQPRACCLDGVPGGVAYGPRDRARIAHSSLRSDVDNDRIGGRCRGTNASQERVKGHCPRIETDGYHVATPTSARLGSVVAPTHRRVGLRSGDGLVPDEEGDWETRRT